VQPHHAYRKGFISELKRAGADPDAVEYLVGHSLGLRGVYTDPDALPLRDAVNRIPPLPAASRLCAKPSWPNASIKKKTRKQTPAK